MMNIKIIYDSKVLKNKSRQVICDWFYLRVGLVTGLIQKCRLFFANQIDLYREACLMPGGVNLLSWSIFIKQVRFNT